MDKIKILARNLGIILFMIGCASLFISIACADESMNLGKRIRFSIGTDLFQPQYKKQPYKFNDYSTLENPLPNLSKISLGVSYRLLENYPLYCGFKTNRLLNHSAELTAIDIKTNAHVNAQQKFISDSVYLGTSINRYLTPLFVISHITSSTTLSYKNGINISSHNAAFWYGIGISLLLNQNHSVSLVYFLPNNQSNTKRAFGVSYNLLF